MAACMSVTVSVTPVTPISTFVPAALTGSVNTGMRASVMARVSAHAVIFFDNVLDFIIFLPFDMLSVRAGLVDFM